MPDRKTNIIFLLFFILLCSSCGDRIRFDRLLKEAETLSVSNPDSAMRLMEDAEFLILGDAEFSRWCMLWGKIEEMREQSEYDFVPFLSIARWTRAKNYFDKKGTEEERAWIRVYLGRSYKENDSNYNGALETYKEALEYAVKAESYHTAGIICSYMADLYMDRHLYDEARKQYEANAEYQKKCGNRRSLAIALNNIGFCYACEEDFEKGLDFVGQADSVANSITDSMVMGTIYNTYGAIYEEIGEMDLAENYYFRSIMMDSTECEPTYLGLSTLYAQKGDNEKSKTYLNQAMSEWTQSAVMHQYYLMAKEERRTDTALFYLERYEEMSDSIRTEQDKMHIVEIDRRYDKTRIISEKNNLSITIQRLYTAGLTLLLAIIAAFYIYHKYVRRQIGKRKI